MILDYLVQIGDLISYEIITLDDSGNPKKNGTGSGMRETERVTLVFPSGRKLIIDEACSGCLENTSLIFSEG